mgnify:CR=1 FL=1
MPAATDGTSPAYVSETVIMPLTALKRHPRNYHEHPPDQIEHLKQSMREHKIYRNVVVARDGTMLAGHGVVQAAMELGYTHGPVVQLDLDPMDPRALKLLVGDNEISHLAMPDDRALTELLREVQSMDPQGLLGTGYDEGMLAALLYNTRPKSEVRDKDEAQHWVGMPDYDEGRDVLKITISFRTADDRAAFTALIGLSGFDPERTMISTWWPIRAKDDGASVRFEGK